MKMCWTLKTLWVKSKMTTMCARTNNKLDIMFDGHKIQIFKEQRWAQILPLMLMPTENVFFRKKVIPIFDLMASANMNNPFLGYFYLSISNVMS